MKLRERVKLFRVSAAWPDIDVEQWGAMVDAATYGKPTRSGTVIDEKSAMGISAFFCGVNLIMGWMASCKCILYERLDERSKQRQKAHWLYPLLHDQFNANMTAHQGWRTLTGHILLWGNGYCLGKRDAYRGVVSELVPVHPSRVKVYKLKDGRLQYEVTDEFDAQSKRTYYRDGAEFIFHVPGPGFNGATGHSVLSMARESLGLTAAMEQFGQNFFGSGINAGGFLQHPKNISKEASTRLTESIQANYGGMANQGKWVVLEEGITFNRNTIPLEDAQFLSSRTFQIQEVARWLNLPPHKLKELSRATFSNIEHQQIETIQDCLHPWAALTEAEIWSQLIPGAEKPRLFAEFLLESMLRGDTLSRQNAMAIQRQWGILKANEWRSVENMNPLEGDAGEKTIIPSNYVIADKAGEDPGEAAGKPPQFDPPGTPPEEDPPDEEPEEDEE